MTTLTYRDQEFGNWADYFHWLFSKDGLFDLPETGQINQTLLETYRYKDKDRQTEIIVAYLDKYDKLIYYNIIHPLTVGYTEYQKKSIQYFEQGQFLDPPEYGGPGLDFDLTNLQGIDDELTEGPKGHEIQYLKDGQVVKSKIKLPDSSFNMTYRFDKKGLLKRLTAKLTGTNEDKELIERTIDLNEIFEGIKNKTNGIK